MKKLLNTLFVTTQGSYLHRDGETATVRRDDTIVLRLPIHNLQSIVCFGRITVSPPLMQLCAERGVLISYLSETGEFFARVQGAVQGNVLLRRQQYRIADDVPRSSSIAQAIVMAKVANSRSVLQRAQRERPVASATLETASGLLARTLERMLARAFPVDEARGLEGDAARTYFQVFPELIVSQKEHFQFRGRTRRPPLDSVNAMLSFSYTLLAHDCSAALEGVGLDPYVGYLHLDRPGRASLALDLMEELRAVLADRLVLTLINRKQVQPNGFRTTESGAVVMEEATRKTLLKTWQEKKQEEIRHPFLDQSIPWGMLPHAQALLLARHLRGDLDAYPAFVWK